MRNGLDTASTQCQGRDVYRRVCTVTFVYKRAVAVGALSILADGDTVRAATLAAIGSPVCVGQAWYNGAERSPDTQKERSSIEHTSHPPANLPLQQTTRRNLICGECV